ncbi:MAG: queuosine precursor transporter [Olegusella sp.]|nr:queuosine precursor transporter [Olegusella sp.]
MSTTEQQAASVDKKDLARLTLSAPFLVICVLYVTLLILSNLIAGKMWTPLPSVTLPAAVMLFPVTYIFGDIFTEVYGYARARLVIWLGFTMCFLAVVVYMVTIALPYPDFWTNQEAFAAVLGTTPRVFAASLIGYLFGEFSNSMILSKLKVRTGGRHLWMRTIGSTVVGEAFDSVIFITVSFAGTMPGAALLQMICYQYLFKVVFEVVLTPVTYAVIGRLKQIEGVDHFDTDVSYRVL